MTRSATSIKWELQGAVGLQQWPAESNEEFAERLARAIGALTDAQFDDLSNEAATWANDMTTAIINRRRSRGSAKTPRSKTKKSA